MAKPTILIQLDTDAHASVFDAVVAVDAGVEHLLQYAAVKPEAVRELVHGAIFTRGPHDLHQTAIFIGGASVASGEKVMRQVVDCFFGPLRVSVMLDANGANTTAAAAVIAAGKHLQLAGSRATVLGSSGPVGQRVVQLLAHAGAQVRACSRRIDRAEHVCRSVAEQVPGAVLEPVQTASAEQTAPALEDAQLVIAAGALGVELLSESVRQQCSSLQVAIDLNAVPPAGIGSVDVSDKAKERDGAICYGAIGVGGMKMKIHKAAIAKLFEANDQLLDAEEIYGIGRTLDL